MCSAAKDELRDLEFAIRTWNNETCVRIRPYRSGDRSWVRIQDGAKCVDLLNANY